MIKGLAGGVGISVAGGNTSLPYVAMTTENPMQGMIRVWGNDLQVFNGTMWQDMNASYSTITLDKYTLEVLDWARMKRDEEIKLSALAETHPAVKIALDNLNRAKEQLDVTIILSKEHETN